MNTSKVSKEDKSRSGREVEDKDCRSSRANAKAPKKKK